MLVLEGLLGLHRTIQLQLQHYCQGIDLDYHDIEWFALETNRDHSVFFEIISKYCLSGFFVIYDDRINFCLLTLLSPQTAKVCIHIQIPPKPTVKPVKKPEKMLF